MSSPTPSTPTAVAWSDPQRQAAFEQWLATLAPAHGLDARSVRSASADASFRRYLRVDTDHGSRIVMDAPPAHEDCRPFVQMARLLRDGGLNAPEVLAWDEAQGFMLLSDLGDRTYLAALNNDNAKQLYGDALAALVKLQGIDPQGQVPAYDRALLSREMQLFPEWYIARHVGATLTSEEQSRLAECMELILQNNLAQPTVLVHRDYHSRNLMLSGEPGSPANPGVLDFQDAVLGPVTYDLASVLRDAYVELDEEVQIDYAVRYWERARKAGLPVSADFGVFWRDFEWMGLQRHIKVLGIFARLSHRDGKDNYLADLPLVWRYAHRVATRYNGLGPLAHLLERLAGSSRVEGFY